MLVFVDEHALFKKMIDNSRKYERDYGSVQEPIYGKDENNNTIDITNIFKANRISVMTEYLGVRGEKEYNSYSADSKNIDMSTDEHRLSSRLTIKSKYATDTSSEGYYLYIFREYSENLRPKPIYMKVEFNHAGVGHQIPFIIPMRWESESDDSSKKIPISSLSLSSSADTEYLKEGYPLSYVAAQSYIPLYAVYDFLNKEYAYVFDDRYVKETEDGDIHLNLFELKVKDETNESVSDEERVNITRHKQDRGIVDINKTQFDLKHFNRKLE